MNTEVIEQKIARILRGILKDKSVVRNSFRRDESLYEDGIGLDSLDAATFSVVLEREFGTDPYTADRFPQTLEDVIVFYADGNTSS